MFYLEKASISCCAVNGQIFPTIRNDHKLGDVKQQKLISLQVWKPEV